MHRLVCSKISGTKLELSERLSGREIIIADYRELAFV